MPNYTLKKSKTTGIASYSTKYIDGNFPKINSITGGKTTGSVSKIIGNFSSKRNGTMFTESPVLGSNLCPGYVYQNAIPGFAGSMAAVADCPEGVQWNATPFITHDYVSECHFSCYVKIDITKVGNEAPTWVDPAVSGIAYNDTDYVSWDPGVSPYYLRRYKCMNNGVTSSTQPHLDTTNWRSNSDDWQDLQIKFMRPMTSGAGHSGVIFFTVFFSSNQVPPNGAITGGRILANYQGEDHTGGSTGQEFNGENIIKMLGGDWLYIEGYGKCSSASGKNDGSVFLYIRNERTKDFCFQYIDGAESNKAFNDRRLIGTIDEFFNQRTVVDVGWPKAGSGAGPYTFPSNSFIHIHFKRETTALKVYSSRLMINDSPESVYLINGNNFATAMKSGKFLRQNQKSRSSTEIEFDVDISVFDNSDTIYVVERDSNGLTSDPVLWRNPI